MKSFLPILGAVLLMGSGCGGSDSQSIAFAKTQVDGSKLTSTDKDALHYVQTELEQRWIQTDDGWTTEFEQRNLLGQTMPGVPVVQFRQVRRFELLIAPKPVTEAQKLNGTDYRASIQFSDTPMREFRSQSDFSGSAGWALWRDNKPSYGFAVERRKGQWMHSDDSIFDGKRPSPGSVPKDPK
ncbi:MAG TPA: hypothetical protein P5218_14085 [Planctomycetota bacterium]|nr:hypothetical protein [Planctomycetota bacterium]